MNDTSVTMEQVAAPETALALAPQRQFVTFIAGDEVFAVDMAPVQEIIRVPAMVRMPLAPPTLDGLANLRGKVLPIISLRRALGLAERANDDDSRALVIDLGQPMGFVVDRVTSVIGIDASRIDHTDGIAATVNTDLLSGLIRDVGQYPMVMVLNFARLIEREFAAVAGLGAPRAAAALVASAAASSTRAAEPELHLVSFDVSDQEYAIAIDNVQEIVQMPELVVQVPRAQPHVLGVMTLRSKLLPLVALRCLFGLPTRAASEQSRIVVVEIGGAAVGIVVDSVNEVLRVPLRQVETMPALLARDSSMQDITDICQLEGGRRLVSVIAADRLFAHASIQGALTAMEQHNMQETKVTQVVTGGDDEQVVVFRLHDEEFGVPIESVQEIVRVPELLTHVPQADNAVEGVINLRGAVLPVLDLRRRLGLAPVARNDGQRIVVFMLRGVRTGFIVDAVAEVLKVPQHAIEAAPRLSAVQSRLLARMANLASQQRMLQLIDPLYLLDDAELASMAELSA